MDLLQTIEENKKKFIHFNALKFQRFQELLPNITVKRIVNSIPFLLSINHKKLPGYIEGDVPCGIVGYEPDDDTKKFIKAKYPTAKAEINPQNRFIQMLAVMGSIGTVAYNKKSDFDYWVCIDKSSVNPDQLSLFMQKVDAIHKWAMHELEVPVHLFINDIHSVRNNIFAEDEEEAFGTTIGAVLKDEFFRSSIIIAGKIPFWWVIPSNIKDEYDHLYAQLPSEIKDNDFIDLGNLYEISKEDFLGSALFQIIKSLGNPFKSIIKLGVLEKYLLGEETSLLSQKLKNKVLKDEIDDTVLDSYLYMFKEVYDYYSKTISDPSLLDILKINLYLKANPQISKYAKVKDPKNIPYKVKVMLSYIKEWKWTMKEIKELDNFDNWDFNKVMEFWDRVTRFMLLSYQNISQQLPRLNLQSKISESDFMLLSRKIKTYFRREKDKIDHHITFKDTPGEPILYIEPINQGIQNSEWRLYKRDRSESDTFVAITIKTESNLLKLLAWAALNKIYIPSYTRLNLQSGYYRINQNTVIELVNLIYTFFNNEKVKIKNEYYRSESFNLLNMLIINFNIENAEEIKTIHHLYLTSWGESFLKEYHSESDLSNILTNILSDAVRINKPLDEYLVISSPETYKKFYKNISLIFKEAYNHLIEDGAKFPTSFITRIGNKYHLFLRTNSLINCESYNSLTSLLTSISLKPKSEIRYRFFGDDQRLQMLQTVYQNHKQFALTIVVEELPTALLIYILNEKGNLFFVTQQIQLKDIVLRNIFDFCNKVSSYINKACGREVLIKENFKILKMKSDKFGSINFTDITKLVEAEFIGKFDIDNLLNLTVYYQKDSSPKYEFILPGNHKVGPLLLKEIPTVVKKIFELQTQGFEIYPLVREISFNGLKKPFTTSTQYLLEKFKVEYMLEKSLSTKT